MCTEAHIIGDIWSNVADKQSLSLGRGFWNRLFQNVGTAKIDLKTIQLSQPTSKPRSNWMIVVFRGGGPTSKDITVKSSAHLKLKFLIDFCCLLLYYVTVKSTMLLLGFYNQQPLSSREAKAGNWQTQDYQTELQGDQTRPDQMSLGGNIFQNKTTKLSSAMLAVERLVDYLDTPQPPHDDLFALSWVGVKQYQSAANGICSTGTSSSLSSLPQFFSLSCESKSSEDERSGILDMSGVVRHWWVIINVLALSQLHDGASLDSGSTTNHRINTTSYRVFFLTSTPLKS